MLGELVFYVLVGGLFVWVWFYLRRFERQAVAEQREASDFQLKWARMLRGVLPLALLVVVVAAVLAMVD